MARARFVSLVNRTCSPKDVMWDGVPEVIPPGYKFVPTLDAEGKAVFDKGQPVGEYIGAGPDGAPLAVLVELHAAEAYKRQHPIMGTQDPNSTDTRDTDFLLGVEAWGDEIDHVEQSDAIELIDRSLLPEERQNISVRQISGARRLIDKGSKGKRKAALVQRNKRRQAYVLQDLKNPTGIKANYD